jgi:hypothetical protein
MQQIVPQRRSILYTLASYQMRENAAQIATFGRRTAATERPRRVPWRHDLWNGCHPSLA